MSLPVAVRDKPGHHDLNMLIEATPTLGRSSCTPLRILHLEDNFDDTELIAQTLQSAGIPCQITWVDDEEGFSAALRQGEVDVILSDSNLPGFSGLTALKMTRDANVGVPFVFVSGHATLEGRNNALRLGASDFLSKDHRAQLIFLVQRLKGEISGE